MTNQPLIYIIILNWNGWQDSLKCLESLRKLNYENYRVLLIDNGSENDSVEQIKAWSTGIELSAKTSHISHNISTLEKTGIDCSLINLNQNVLLITNKTNLGFSGGCNIGITYALEQMAEYVFLLNNDARVQPDIFNHLVFVSEEVNAAIVGARVFDDTANNVLFSGAEWPKELFLSGSGAKYKAGQNFWESSYAEGSAILLRRDFLEQRSSECGYFLDPTLFMYCEDTEICIYARKHGHRCVIARDALIYHKISNSSGGRGNPRSFYYITRNRIFVAQRWLNLFWKICFHLYYAPSRLILQIIRFRKTNILVSLAVIQGMIDGYLNVSGKWKKHES